MSRDPFDRPSTGFETSSQVSDKVASKQEASFGLYVAHGITKRYISTWSELVLRVPRVLVPVQLDVLMVREEGRTWADCAMQVPDESNAHLDNARDLLPPPFSNLAQTRPRGAYLHWALPDALMHGRQAEGGDGETTFPAVPDRWLVLRIKPSSRRQSVGRSEFVRRRRVDGWVLRAGDRTPRPINLNQWRETGDEPGAAPEGALTALGHGDAGWSGYFDNVVNRFGFYDPLTDVSSGPLAYLVCGWYSKPHLDPLSSLHVHSLLGFHNRLSQLGWEVPEDQLREAAIAARKETTLATTVGLATKEQAARAPGVRFDKFRSTPAETGGRFAAFDDGWWPNQILCHGSVVGIGWPNVERWPALDDVLLPGESGGPPPASSLKVAVGNTTAEALAALLVAAGRPEDEGRVLEAFQLGLLKELDEPDGRARVDAAQHASAFGSMTGGEVEDRIYEPPIQGPNPAPGKVTNTAPGIFARNYRQSVKTEVGRGVAHSAVEGRVTHEQDKSSLLFIDVKVQKARLYEVAERIFAEPPQKPYVGRWVSIKRPLPRFFHPSDPVLLIQGAKRSFRHGGDGRFTANGRLQCRLSKGTVKGVGIVGGSVRMASGRLSPADVLENALDNGSVPPECEDLLNELVVLDPGSAEPLVIASHDKRSSLDDPKAVRSDVRKLVVEQTAWWSLRDKHVDPAPFVALSGLVGTLPSPLAVTPPTRPWCPLHLDWRAEFIPSPDGDDNWSLEEVDYNELAEQVPTADQPPPRIVNLEGRSGLSANAGSIISSAVRRALEQVAETGGGDEAPPKNVVVQYQSNTAATVLAKAAGYQLKVARVGESQSTRADLMDVAEALENMDVLNGVFEDMHIQLRGGLIPDGQTHGSTTPETFFGLRSGFLRVTRLRLVDGFGQFLDLLGSSAETEADATRIVTAPPMLVAGRTDLQALPPRFTSPARLWFRYIKGEPASPSDTTDARLATDETPTVSPVCGYLMANHIDRALEFFGADGSNRGMVRHDDLDGRLVWEDAPGTPITIGQTPARAIANSFLAQTAQSLLDWGLADQQAPLREDVLCALMRVIDTTLWTVDPFGHQGDEHLSLLVGHPVVVMRAQLRLEVLEPVDPAQTVNQIAVPVRLGALTHWQDGLLGYFVNDDYRTLYVPNPASADQARAACAMDGFLGYATQVKDYFNSFHNTPRPVTHPYVNRDGFFLARPNQTVSLTLLVEPLTRVYATTGLLPRKDIGMQREWVQEALARLAPTFRFGPVLIDPKRVRMPVATELNGTWSWDHRTDVNVWANDPVSPATQEALLAPDPPRGSEGWLRLTPKPVEEEEG